MVTTRQRAMRWYGTPTSPIRDVLHAMTNHWPPDFVSGYDLSGLSDGEHSELQDWAVKYCKPRYLTGIGLIEAAETMVDEAVSNGNIPPPPCKMRVTAVIRQIYRQRKRLLELLGTLTKAVAEEEKEIRACVEKDVTACKTRLSVAKTRKKRRAPG